MLKRALVTKIESSIKKEMIQALTEIPDVISNANNILTEKCKKYSFSLDFPDEILVQLNINVRVQDYDEDDEVEFNCHYDTVKMEYTLPIKRKDK